MNSNQLHLIAALVEPTIRRDNDNLAAANRVLRQDIRQLLLTTRTLANERATLIDQVRYLEGIAERFMARVALLEEAILDCDDPSHNSIRRVRRRLEYESDNEPTEIIDLMMASDEE